MPPNGPSFDDPCDPVLDPSGGTEPEYRREDIDKFLLEYRFGLAIADGIKLR
jgi:hypothetical protein